MRNEFFVLEKLFSSVPVLLVALMGCVSFGFRLSFFSHASSFPGFLSSSDHILQRVFFTSGLLDKKNKTNNDSNVLLFVFIIPHSYRVSVWKAAGRRNRTGRRRELGILLGRKQERSDPRVSGQAYFLSLRSPGSPLTQAPSL